MENKEVVQSSKTVPVTQIDHVDSYFSVALALALQEQERVFSMLETTESDDDNEASYNRSHNNDYEYFDCLETGGDLELLMGLYINNADEDTEDDDYEEEEDEDEIDPDVLSYEELIALGEIIVEKRGLPEKEISSCLVPFKYQSVNERETRIDRCVICQVEYKDDEGLVALPTCKHPYHSDCISKWLQMKKRCPICSIEISSSPSSNEKGFDIYR